MNWDFFVTSALLGVGLAMDACAVSMANGLKQKHCLTLGRALLIALMFAVFQALMPMISYAIGHVILQLIAPFIPYVALVLLGFVGGKMLKDGICNKEEQDCCQTNFTFGILIVQAIATSIDALSVGFSIADYTIVQAVVCTGIIALVTFPLALGSVYLGKKFGTALGNKAEIVGGVILILIGVEIFVKGVFFS